MNDEDKPLNQQGQESHLSDPSVGGEIFFELRGTKLKLKFSRGGKSRSCSKYKKFDKSSADEHPRNVSEMCQASNSRNAQISRGSSREHCITLTQQISLMSLIRLNAYWFIKDQQS